MSLSLEPVCVGIDVSKAKLDVCLLPSGETHCFENNADGIGQLVALLQAQQQPVAALVGVAPLNRDSGTLRGHRRIFGGRADVRTGLYMATVVAMRFNPVIRLFAQRLRSAGKAFKVIVVAAMRKLLTILNLMVKNQEPWRTPALQNA